MFFFNLLAFYAFGQVLDYVFLHSRPIELFPGGSDHLLVSWMTRIGSLMYFIHNEPLQVVTHWNIKSVSVSEKTSFDHLIAFIFYSCRFLL
jgi:hypothetical protein